jgi:hypothetical protein
VDPPPLETLRDKLHECRRPTWSELCGLVCEQIAINSYQYVKRPGTSTSTLDAAVVAFHDAAFAGHVKLTGKLKMSSDHNHQEIPHSYFSEPRGIYWLSNEIRKSNSLFKTVYARKNTKLDNEFCDVLVDRASFQACLSARGYKVVVEPTPQETFETQDVANAETVIPVTKEPALEVAPVYPMEAPAPTAPPSLQPAVVNNVNQPKKRATLETYTNRQDAHYNQTRKWFSREDDINWAKDNNYSVEHVRGELRRSYKANLSPEKREQFEKHGKRATPK